MFYKYLFSLIVKLYNPFTVYIRLHGSHRRVRFIACVYVSASVLLMSMTSFATAKSVLDTWEIQMAVEQICSQKLLKPDYYTNSRVGLSPGVASSGSSSHTTPVFRSGLVFEAHRHTLVSLSLRPKDLLGPVTRVKKKTPVGISNPPRNLVCPTRPWLITWSLKEFRNRYIRQLSVSPECPTRFQRSRD